VQCKNELNEFVEEWQPQIIEYLRGYQRIEKDRADDAKATVPGLRKQREEIESKWRAIAAPLLPQIDRVLDNYESGMNGLAPEPEKDQPKKSVKFTLPGEGRVSVELVDKYLPIFDMVVGILLMLGLLTPIAGIAAGLFLLSVVLTQFPGSYGAQPTYYQAIEMVGCFVLAFADAGRYAGLDFLPWSFWNRNRASTEE
ncbi:MAG: DoxX family protein, partial [Pirellula sp.]|nr:DoxX family protein [Pirellula sp.]